MNEKLEQFKNDIKDKEVRVIGIGISNIPLIKYLVRLGAKVTACDKRSAEQLGDVYKELKSIGTEMILGENYLEDITQPIVFKTPGMRYDVSQLVKARENGSNVISEMELFFDLCPAHITAVTGSDGKTTTTTLIYKMLTAQGYKTWLGGNIGNPLLSEVENMTENDKVVLELSSFQLHTMRKSPNIAVMTNITPNHLDMHKDYQEYIDAKKNIMLYQDSTSRLVVNMDNDITCKIGGEAKGEVLYFSRKSQADVCIADDVITRKGQPILNIHDIKIPGNHNIENYMTAIAAVGDMVEREIICEVARTFGGVEHRIELVRELDGVKYYNSSIDSSPNRTKNTLSVFPEKVIMISGGKDKGIPYDEIGEVIAEHVKVLILIGATADKIEKALNDEINRTGKGKDIEVIRVTEYTQAVNTAREKAQPNDIVVLSPASTSFDMFKNFEERGKLFKKLVNELK